MKWLSRRKFSAREEGQKKKKKGGRKRREEKRKEFQGAAVRGLSQSSRGTKVTRSSNLEEGGGGGEGGLAAECAALTSSQFAGLGVSAGVRSRGKGGKGGVEKSTAQVVVRRKMVRGGSVGGRGWERKVFRGGGHRYQGGINLGKLSSVQGCPKK